MWNWASTYVSIFLLIQIHHSIVDCRENVQDLVGIETAKQKRCEEEGEEGKSEREEERGEGGRQTGRLRETWEEWREEVWKFLSEKE